MHQHDDGYQLADEKLQVYGPIYSSFPEAIKALSAALEEYAEERMHNDPTLSREAALHEARSYRTIVG